MEAEPADGIKLRGRMGKANLVYTGDFSRTHDGAWACVQRRNFLSLMCEVRALSTRDLLPWTA
jgi:hypothetical protein